MLQLSTYCSASSVEFTNRLEKGFMKRLDDPFLILDDPERVRSSGLRSQIPAFDADDMLALRAAAKEADIVVLSWYRMMEINYFRGTDGLMVRFDEDAVRDILKSDMALWFVRNFNFVPLSNEERHDLVRRALHEIASWVKPGAKVLVLLENTRKLENNPDERELRQRYNQLIIDIAQALDNVTYVDINRVTNADWLFDDGFHMHRQGYYELAQAVTQVFSEANDERQEQAAAAPRLAFA
jgi:hypothetical protein